MSKLVVCYPGGLSSRMDEAIEQIVGARCIGAGFGMFGGMRDLEFRVASAGQAEWIAAKIRRLLPTVSAAASLPSLEGEA